ncbi:MAG: hypothetical protein JEZ00_01750 [Anaerolineaceae bacterium]|nr:hypothetical protein [Anaerolineaceae bacterium]
MKLKNIALIILSTLIMMGCEQMQMLQMEPDIPVVNTVDLALPTNTKWVFLTPTPEFIKTATPNIPTFAPIDGWQKIDTDTFEIYLPERYKGGSIDENIDQLIEYFHSMGEEYKWYADTIYLNPDTYKLMSVDTKKGSSGFITHISITSKPAMPAYSIDAAMSSVSAGLAQGYQVVDQDLIEINGYEAAQIVAEFQSNDIAGKEIIYLIKGDSKMWILTFATGADEYNSRILEFVQIVDSFRIKTE